MKNNLLLTLLTFFTLLSVAFFHYSCSEELNISESPGILGDGTLESRLEEIRDHYDLPSLGIVYIEGDQIVEQGVTGVRASGEDVPVTIYDKWHLGSLTKAMTSTMIGRLVAQEILDWSTTVEEVFPNDLEVIREVYRDLRIDDLLTHTSGLANNVVDVPSWDQIAANGDDEVKLRRQWSIELLGLEPETSRGNFYYSNTGYIVAGAMVEEITGKSWRTLMQEEVFDPLDMTYTGFMAPGNRGQYNQPWGHTRDGNDDVPLDPGTPESDNPPAIGPAGVVHSTFEDYAKYMVIHLREEGSNYLDSDIVQKLHTPAIGTRSGLGWGVIGSGSTKQLLHDGSNNLWYARVGLNIGDQNGYLMVTNQGGEEARDAIDELQEFYNARISNSD